MLKRILVPTDFSEIAQEARNYARALAEVFGAEIHLLHVLEDPLPGWKPASHVCSIPAIREAMEQDANSQLAKELADPADSKFKPLRAVVWGRPYEEIAQYAKQNDIDLIVLGTHGRGPLRHVLLGSVAEKVVHKAPCPVLTVGAPTERGG